MPLICELLKSATEPCNTYSHNARVVKMKNTNSGEQDATTVGHMPDSLAEVLYKPLLEKEIKKTFRVSGQSRRAPPGGEVLPIMAYRGRLRPKGVRFSSFRYIKG